MSLRGGGVEAVVWHESHTNNQTVKLWLIIRLVYGYVGAVKHKAVKHLVPVVKLDGGGSAF